MEKSAPLSLISWNIEGLKSCIDDVKFLEFVYNFDIVFLCETWQKSIDDFSINGYESVTVPRPQSLYSRRGHGGICLFFKHGLVNGITVFETNEIGFIWIKLCKRFF